ncbi:kinase-like domain-containing protein [Mycena rebaudengoi]|nr:kinase-like domain-containing protein [Mycena rebaudengoi]
MPQAPGNIRRGTADLALSLGKTAAQITAQFSPVPGLAPAAELICGIIVLCQNVTRNRNAASQLRDRCHRLVLALYEKQIANERMAGTVEAVVDCLGKIHKRMEGWSKVQTSTVRSFLHQDEIAKDIERCHEMLTECLTNFQVGIYYYPRRYYTDPVSQILATIGIQEWQIQMTLNNQQDKRELIDFLAEILNSQTIAQDALQSQSSDIRELMSMMQQLLGENIRTADRLHNGLSSNLYELQLQSRELLPDFHLRSGEVTRIGQFPISGTSAMDIYEGLYLQREKVAIKVVRAVNSNEHSLRRFNRECEIWKDLWRIDQGKHVLPFYGFCQSDGPFPYMPNGTALNYAKKYDGKIDYLRLVRGIALGVQVLHGMNPPVVHGDIKASNIVIDALGHPLIADFGLSRVVEDITGIPFSQSRGVSDSYRWFAPEVCIGQGVLSLSSDVYAYGMTVLELLTHEQPYRDIKHTTEVVIRSAKGEQPARPTSPRILERGLDDHLWALLGQCWINEPSQRPSIQQVLEMFPQ